MIQTCDAVFAMPGWRLMPVALFVTLVATSCAGTRQPGSTSAAVSSVGTNNVIIAQSHNTRHKGDGTGTLLIKGKNNIITYRISDSDIESYNTKTVTIIEGDNNNITSTIRKCVLLYKDHADTIIIKGNQLKLDFSAENIKQLVLGSKQNAATNKANRVSREATGGEIAKKKPVEGGTDNYPRYKRAIDTTATKSRGVALTRLNNPYSPGVILADTTDRSFDWSTTENATKLTGEEQVYVTDLKKYLPLLAAVAHYTRQAQHNDYEACYQLGLLHDNQDPNVLADLPRAVRYYELAARHNHAAAAFRLGQIYELGDFELGQITADRVKAKYYYELAAQNGSFEATEKLQSWHN